MNQEEVDSSSSRKTTINNIMHPFYKAEQQLVELLGYSKTLDLPPTHSGRFCGHWWHHQEESDAHIEDSRQRKLEALGKTDEQLMEDIFRLLSEFPKLASTKYENYSKESIFPLWYVVLHGGSLSMVEKIYEMYPKALVEPLVRQELERVKFGISAGFTIQIYTLLNAACSPSLLRGVHTSDEVVLFVAQKGPRSALTNGSFRSNRPPFSSRLFQRPATTRALVVQQRAPQQPQDEGVYRASLDLIRELVPDSEWTMDILNRLFNEGYDAKVLEYAVDQIMLKVKRDQDDNDNDDEDDDDKNSSSNKMLKITHSSLQENPGCFLDADRAQVLERVLPTVTTFHCKPPRWSLDGFLQTCQILSGSYSQSIKHLTLKLHMDMFADVNNNELNTVLSPLEGLFAANKSVDTLRLQVQKPFLEAIANGLGSGRGVKSSNNKNNNKVALVLEMIGESPSVDITEPIQCLLKNGCLKCLCINGPPTTYQLDFSTTMSTTLRGDNTLRELEMDASLTDSHVDQLVELLKANSTLQQLVVHNSRTGVDYTGFTSCPLELTRFSNPWCGRIHCPQRADEILYYTRLNRCGRRLAQRATTTRLDFIRLVEDVQSSKKRSGENDLDRFNVLFGLVAEAAPRLAMQVLSAL